MKTLKLQAKDFKEVNGYKEYIGKEDLSNRGEVIGNIYENPEPLKENK